MTLPPHIVDLVGSLLDEGWDDDRICNAVVLAWRRQTKEAGSGKKDSLENT